MMSGIDFSVSSSSIGEFGNNQQQSSQLYYHHLPHSPNPNQNLDSSLPPPLPKKKRNLPGKPDPDAEVIALSPNTLMATNRFICEICNKGFQRDQNLQLHRRGHNLPWKLRQRSNKETVKKKVYICPEKCCVHHDPSRALGDLTGIKKHFSRKHGEKKWKCEKCSKKYAVQSDWKAHSKTCGTREYKCDCGTLFSRKDSFITHRAFCDALAEESAKLISSVTAANSRLNFIANNNNNNNNNNNSINQSLFNSQLQDHNFESSFPQMPPSNLYQISNQILSLNNKNNSSKTAIMNLTLSSSANKQQQQAVAAYNDLPSFCSATGGGGGGGMSATALLMKAAQLGSTKSNDSFSSGSNSVGVVMSSSSNNVSFESGNYYGGEGNGLRDFFGRKKGEGNDHQLIIPLMEMTKFANSMSSEMGLSPFIGNIIYKE
ncbi:zinc finger protein BALDIBIS-like [Benincasa hispida]|uniref:zinc finger protein BALDIBIS-like n=1 Tax=Benincasa hispida TaxID=102211 RepID=UPI0018FFCABF|nr:zinc finger protein BALDIBIS-like [Benincasa hispida]